MRARVAGSAAAILVAAGCTQSLGPASSGTTIHGTASGAAIPTTTTIGLVGSQAQTTEPSAYAGALITNLSDGCAELRRNGNPSASTALTLLVTTTTSAVAPGTYPIDSTGLARGSYTVDGQDCQEVVNEYAATGSITLTTVSASLIEGSFDVQMNNGDHLTGTFVAPVCAANLASTSDAACGT